VPCSDLSKVGWGLRTKLDVGESGRMDDRDVLRIFIIEFTCIA
jgi:hypothetical protein